MKKANKSNVISYVVIALVAVLLIAGGAYAYSVSQNVNVAGDYNYYEAEGQPAPVVDDLVLGATPGTYVVIDELELGSAVSARLNFAAAATTTPGSLFRIYNSGPRKICTQAEMDVKVAPIDGYSFAVATSTNYDSWSTVYGSRNIIASSTVATSSPDILNNIDNAGALDDSWEWNVGEFLLGVFDSSNVGDNASSTDYSGYASGRFYVSCHVE